MAIYKVRKSTNPNYWVHILCRKHNFELICDMPEQLAMGVTSEWESRLPYTLSSLLEKAVGSIAPKLSDVIGVSPQIQSLSFQMWTGTSPIEMPMQILFDAETSAQRDVYEPIVYLESLVLPVSGAGGLLYPPGPIWGGDRGYGIDIKFGRFMLFRNCIVASANKVLDSRLDANGFPISGSVDVTFRTSYVYGHQDFIKSMGLAPLSGTVDKNSYGVDDNGNFLQQ